MTELGPPVAPAAAQKRRRRIAMTADERDAFLSTSRVARVASLRADGSPDVTPLWFAWVDGSLWLSSLLRSQRWTNLARDPRVSVVIDDGDTYETLRGIELSGRAAPVGEQPRTGLPEPSLEEVETVYAEKYSIDPDHVYDGLHAWLRIDVDRELSWDHSKIAAAVEEKREGTG